MVRFHHHPSTTLKMKIGFYGSSLCSDFENYDAIKNNYRSYLTILRDTHKMDVCNLGVSGADYWHIILVQFKKMLEDNPDVAVFIWPANEFIFARNYRPIYKDSVNEGSRLCKTDTELWEATKLYYKHMHDAEKSNIEWLAALHYFDTVLLPTVKNTKIIHMWEYGDVTNVSYDTDLSNSSFIKNIKYPHDWKTGTQLIAPLIALSLAGQWPRRPNVTKVLAKDPRCNHLDGVEKNELLVSWILELINANGTIDKTQEIIDLYDQMLAKNASSLGM